MASLNLDNDNVFMHSMTMEEARNLTPEIMAEVESKIDEAQGHVHMQRDAVAYVVIAITGGRESA